MKRNKRGFTLAEILVSTVVIGVIMAISVQTTKIVRTSYTSLCHFAFNNVQDMVRELFAGETTLDSRTATMACHVSTANGININKYILKPDNIDNPVGIPHCLNLTNDTGVNTFCNQLVDMLNTSGTINCSDLYTATINPDTDEPYISDLNAKNPNFITTNGNRYYLTKRSTDAKVSDTFGYRLLAIDLNGKRPPNATDTNRQDQPPDIVTFLIMDTGEVFPLAAAADNYMMKDGKNALYLNSKIKGYYYHYDENRTETVPEDCTLKGKDGNIKLCNYAVVYVQNENKLSFFSYRDAYCGTLGLNEEPAYKSYCLSSSKISKCPPSSDEQRFDLCRVENIKPSFRYSL